MIKTPRFQWRGHRSIPGWGNKILQEAGHSQKKKKKGYSVKVLRNSSSSSCASCTVRPNKPKHWSWELRNVYCKAIEKDGWLLLPKPQTPRRVSAKQFWRQVRQGWGWLLQTSWCRNSLFLQKSGKVRSWSFHKSPTRQMLFSVLQLLPLYEGNLKDHSLENKMSCIFQAICNIINSKQKR